MSYVQRKHNPNALYTCGCLDCKAERLLRQAVQLGYSQVILRNPDTGEEKTIVLSGLPKAEGAVQ